MEPSELPETFLMHFTALDFVMIVVFFAVNILLPLVVLVHAVVWAVAARRRSLPTWPHVVAALIALAAVPFMFTTPPSSLPLGLVAAVPTMCAGLLAVRASRKESVCPS